MISTVKATMHKAVGAMADDLLPPRDLANAAFALMVWASSKMSAEERDKLLNGFSIATFSSFCVILPPTQPST
jgi:hypothetical protein